MALTAIPSKATGWVHLVNSVTLKRKHTIARHYRFKTKWVEIEQIDGEIVYSEQPRWNSVKQAIAELTGNIAYSENLGGKYE